MNKMSYISGVSDEPLLGLTIGEAFDHTVNNFPDNDAIISVHQNIRLSYRGLDELITRCTKALAALDIKKGERLGVWAPNCVEWLIMQIATAKLGVILVNINPSYRIHELEYALTQSGCCGLLMADTFKTSNYSQMIYELAPELRTSEGKAFNCGKLPNLRFVISLATSPKQGMIMWDSFMKSGTAVSDKQIEIIQRSLSFDDPINIQYTSGTTGYPKGATLSHHNILNNGYLVTKMQRFSNEDRLVIPIPLYHCFGMVMGNLGCIIHGATMIYPCDSFSAEEVLLAVQEEKATALYGVPTMFFAELNHPDFSNYDLTSLRTGVMAGSLCPSDLMRRVNKEMHMEEVEIAYGMTETSPVSTQTRHDSPFDKRVSTVGQIMPHTEIKIIDPETGQVIPIGQTGELCTRGYCVMLGYWDNPEQTAQAIDAARWMHTGDLATMDEEGYVYIVGRIKDMIIRGGENIYPKEIEEFLYQHPDIVEVQVIGVPDEKYGEQVCAWVQKKEHSDLDEAAVKAYCESKISHFKVPYYIVFVEEFPMTVTGKIRKVEMREKTIGMLGLKK